MKRATVALVVLALLLGVVAGQARADGYALAAIRNATGVTITYYYWWGSDSWDNVDMNSVGTATLRPGAWHYYAWPYGPGEEGTAPPLNVAFLSYTPGRYDGYYKWYTLPKWESAVAAYEYYQKYHFGWAPSGRLDVFEGR